MSSKVVGSLLEHAPRRTAVKAIRRYFGYNLIVGFGVNINIDKAQSVHEEHFSESSNCYEDVFPCREIASWSYDKFGRNVPAIIR